MDDDESFQDPFTESVTLQYCSVCFVEDAIKYKPVGGDPKAKRPRNDSLWKLIAKFFREGSNGVDICTNCYNAIQRAKKKHDEGGDAVVVLPSTLPGAGGGLFALKRFDAHQHVATYGGLLVRMSFESIQKSRVVSTHMIGTGDGAAISGHTGIQGTIEGSIKGVASKINHPNNGGASANVRQWKRKGKVTARSLKAIEIGEELLWSYGNHYEHQDLNQTGIPWNFCHLAVQAKALAKGLGRREVEKEVDDWIENRKIKKKRLLEY